MTELKIIIDGTTHEYVKVDAIEYACKTCSLHRYCVDGHARPHFCKLFDLTGNCRPTGVYGHFKVTNTL